MTDRAAGEQPKAPRLLRPLTSRPHMLISIAVGLVLYFAAAPWAARAVTRVLIGWDGGVLTFLALSMHFMSCVDHGLLKRRAIEHDEGGHLILILTVLASIASIGALIAELSAAKGLPGAGLRIALAAGTVVISWLFTQIVFAIHYAHVYYRAEEEGAAHDGGLEFGDHAEPDYWDFVHFSLVMGATAQTADIVIRSKRIRRIGTIHTLVAFGFNTAILATMINLAANLF
ncbi:MAG TPA: DUF1345 domain-containing protein [Rhizomicrobium sp.]|nr:DUF1345 domain-containing protein [Rhizomicrobium sp.]